MTKALMIALTVIAACLTGAAAQAGERYWIGEGVYAPAAYCGYAVRRRGHPSAIEYYFVYRCLAPEEAFHRRYHGKVLRSRG
ncbi:MAG TPA: hypothetical protein VG986_22950 [Pseudolabrys sp.]|nr:hypothetical protein [Pseudolabrys sp.]